VRGARDREPTEAPLWARAEADAASFAPRRIAPERHAPSRFAILVAVAIVGLVGLANGLPGVPSGGAVAPPPAALDLATTADAPSPHVAIRPPAIGSVEAGPGSAPVTLRTPTGRDGPITTAAVPVEGLVALRASSIRVALELDKFHRIDAVEIDTNPDGMLRPDTTPAFHLNLALPSPRPIGQLWVVITAYDRSGHPLGTVRRGVLIGAETAG
jgi:hypothetical protein